MCLNLNSSVRFCEKGGKILQQRRFEKKFNSGVVGIGDAILSQEAHWAQNMQKKYRFVSIIPTKVSQHFAS